MTKGFRNRYRIKSVRAPWWDYASAGAYFITICTKGRHQFFGEIREDKMYLSPIGVIADLMWFEIQHHAAHCELGPFIVMPDHVHGVLILKDDNHSDLNERTLIASKHMGDPKDQSILSENVKANPNDISVKHDGWSNQEDDSIGQIDLSQQQDSSIKTNDHSSNQEDHSSNQEDHPANRNDQPANRNVETRHALSLHFDLLRTEMPTMAKASLGLPKSRYQNQGKNTISSIIGSYKSAVTKHAHRLGYDFAWQPRFYDHIIRDADEMDRISAYIRNNVLDWGK